MKKLLLFILVALAVSATAQITVHATKYHPGRGCGWGTASGSRIDKAKLNRYELRWIAMSPDLYKKLGVKYGDTVILDSKNHRLNGKWVAKDKMSARLHNCIDLMLPYRDTMHFTSPIKMTIRKK